MQRRDAAVALEPDPAPATRFTRDGQAASAERREIGDTLRFELRITSTALHSQALVVDYRVHFVKADGRTSPKVFKLKRLELAARASVQLRGRVSLAPMTTRRHYPGRHSLEAVVNGVSTSLDEFVVVPSQASS